MNIEKRTKDLQVVRNEGYVPGVIYGHNIESTKIQTPLKDIIRAFYDNGLSMSFEVELDGEKHVVFFKEIQREAINQNNILHFDLMKVSKDDMITAAIPVHLVGRDEVEKKGFIVQLLSNTLDFEFPVTKGISSLDVNIASLEGGDSLLVSDIDIPEDFVLQEDPQKVIVSITYPTIEKDEDEDGSVEGLEPVEIEETEE